MRMLRSSAYVRMWRPKQTVQYVGGVTCQELRNELSSLKQDLSWPVAASLLLLFSGMCEESAPWCMNDLVVGTKPLDFA